MTKRILYIILVTLIISFVFMPTTTYAYDELKNTDPDKYYILLDLRNQIVTVFEKDEMSEYTKVVRRFICTSGRTKLDPEDPEDKGTPTPRGIYKIGGRERFGEFVSFRGTFARYWTQIVGGIYFHSVMFSERDIDTLQSGAFRRLGNNTSHGCVRLYVEDAKWLYYYVPPGTTIEVSTTEPRNREVTKKLKTTLSFSEYKKLQKNIYDIDPLPNKAAWVVKDNAPMRTGNGGSDRIRMRFEIGTQLEVLQTGVPWSKVRYEKKEGYMLSAYLTFEKGIVSSKEDADIITRTTYMYTLPSDEAQRIVKVPTYTSVKILGPDFDGWTRIFYSGETGYIETRYLKKGWGTIMD